MTENKKVLVTGASGFIGSYVLDELARNGFDAYCLDISRLNNSKNFISCSILDAISIRNIIEDFDVVFNFAAFSNIDLVPEDPKLCVELNIIGVVNILEAIRCSKKKIQFVQISSVYVNSLAGHLYTSSKRAAEEICANYRELYDIDITVLRLGTVYAENSRQDDVIYKFLKCSVENLDIDIHGDGSQRRYFIHAKDIAEACISLIRNYDNLNIYMLVPRYSTSILELAYCILKFCPDINIKFSPQHRHSDYLGEDMDKLEIERTYSHLKWQPRIQLIDGLSIIYENLKMGNIS